MGTNGSQTKAAAIPAIGFQMTGDGDLEVGLGAVESMVAANFEM
jgi:hypothetical protein